eukprot:UN06581
MTLFTSLQLLILIYCSILQSSSIIYTNSNSDGDETFYYEINAMSTTEARDGDSRNIWLVSSGGVGFIILCALCCVCCCSQYRRKHEDHHREEGKHKQKQEVYGADVMDDTMFVDDDEIIQFTMVDSNDNDTLRMNEGTFVVVDDRNNALMGE